MPQIQILQNHPAIVVKRRRWPWVIMVVLFALIAAAAMFLYLHTRKQLSIAKQQVNQNSSSVPEDQDKQLVDKIKKLIILPKDEEPTIATVTDLSKLQGQSFFANAEVG